MTHHSKPYSRTNPAQAAYEVRILEAYMTLSLERKSPDVPIAALYAWVGGSLKDFHATLEACCRGRHAVPTIGEPVFASAFAREHALALDGERFLNIKFV